MNKWLEMLGSFALFWTVDKLFISIFEAFF